MTYRDDTSEISSSKDQSLLADSPWQAELGSQSQLNFESTNFDKTNKNYTFENSLSITGANSRSARSTENESVLRVASAEMGSSYNLPGFEITDRNNRSLQVANAAEFSPRQADFVPKAPLVVSNTGEVLGLQDFSNFANIPSPFKNIDNSRSASLDRRTLPMPDRNSDFSGDNSGLSPKDSMLAQSVKAVVDVARQMGASTKVLYAAIASMLRESKGDPTAVGDNGTSFGLFQLHKGGHLTAYGLTREQAFDRHINAKTALTEFMKYEGRHDDPGTLAAASQRPANKAAYAAFVRNNMGLAAELARKYGGYTAPEDTGTTLRT